MYGIFTWGSTLIPFLGRRKIPGAEQLREDHDHQKQKPCSAHHLWADVFAMNFTSFAFGQKPSGTRKDWPMSKLYPCSVLTPYWLHVKTWKQLPTSLKEYLSRGRKYTIKKNKAYGVRGQKRRRAQCQRNRVSFVREPRAVTFKLLLLTETIIGLKPLCM